MLIEPRDFALARNSAAPALASSEAASAPLCGNIEMPVVTPVRTDLPSIWNSTASASASCSASSMPATGCLPSMINPNSSPREPSHDAAARRSLDAARHLDQQLVAGGVAEHVVDFLQAVEVERQHREFLVGAAASLDHLRQRLQECGAVRQIGQAVMIGHVGHARFGLAAVGDVLVGLDQILRLAGFIQHRHAAGQEQPQPVLGADRMFFDQQAALLDRRLVARDDQLGFLAD